MEPEESIAEEIMVRYPFFNLRVFVDQLWG
jgi:hypothetical protein